MRLTKLRYSQMIIAAIFNDIIHQQHTLTHKIIVYDLYDTDCFVLFTTPTIEN